MKSNRQLTRRAMPRRSALVVALAVGMGISGMAMGQATTGLVFGTAPQNTGETVKVVSASGVTRTANVVNGRYSIGSLPVGNYTVSLIRDGQVVSTHKNVTVRVGSGTQSNFGGNAATEANAQQLGAVQVSANALPAIDVTTSASSLTLTAQQLRDLPIGQSADSVALLAPSVTPGSDYFNGVSFGGAGITENAYYVNGFNVTGIYNSEGYAYTLPYGAIKQQQTLTHGYSAKYGRADGGIINQIGKSGTNEWHFGARVQWVPRSLRQGPKNQYYPHPELGPEEELSSTTVHPGELRTARSYDKGWDQLLSAYIGGPLVKDTLYVFVAAETDEQKKRTVGTVTSGQDSRGKGHESNFYGKVDWNINDSNIFEYTFLRDQQKGMTGVGYGTLYNFDNDKGIDLERAGSLPYNEYDYKSHIFHYTSYIGDNGTLSAIYGRSRVQNPTTQASPLPPIGGSTSQNPALNGGTPIVNNQTTTTAGQPNPGSKSHGLRVDFSYQLQDHKLSAGIDNMWFSAHDEGTIRSGPGYYWIYGKGDPGKNIVQGLNVGAPGGDGYYVAKDIIVFDGKMSARQKAWYIQDEWQLTPDVLLNIGLRNDRFDNYNASGQAFITEKNQWEPRLGMSWDVNGDGSFKIFANAGRYYLALPQAVANRQATPSTFTDQYFTYTGINADGEPIGPCGDSTCLTPVPTVDGDPAGPGPVSRNGEYGTAPNPKTVASVNIKPQYQDEYRLGFDKMLGDNWVYGASATYRKLGVLIDDGCYPDAIVAAMQAQGINPDNYDVAGNNCHLFNPGRTNVFHFSGLNGAPDADVAVSQDQTGLPSPQREYYALNLHLEHPFDGTWFGRVDYTFSRSWGNSEGQVRSDIGQGDISATEDWDYRELMVGARGYLANNIRHQLKAYGAWQITPEWMLSGQLQVFSGHPVDCLGFYGPDPLDPATNNPGAHYGPDYHWCRGQIYTPGSTTTPWTRQLNLGVTYRPAFADSHLAFKAYVFNVLGEMKPVQLYPGRMAATGVVATTYHMPHFYQQPRYVRFTISYDY
jgi:hypothetical protein